MDAYAFALTLGTAGLAAMTVLGFHHVPGRSGHGRQSSPGHSGGHAGSHAGHGHYYSNSVISREPGGAA